MFKNLDFQNDRVRSKFWVICFLSWISFIATNFFGFINLVVPSYVDSSNRVSNNIIWGFLTYYVKAGFYHPRYYPIEWENYYLIIIFLIILLLSLISFIVFAYYTYYKKDDNVFNVFFDTYSRFNFIPILCGSFLFLSGIFKENMFRGWGEIKNYQYVSSHLTKYSLDLICSFVGVISSVIIKKTLKLEQPFYIVLIIKDGFYSVLLALFTYSFFYSSAYIGYLSKYKICLLERMYDICNADNSGALVTIKGCGSTFSVLVGIINLGIAIYLKDYIISAMNAIIYLGFLIFFYSISGKRKDDMNPPSIEGIFDIIIFVCTIVELIYFLYIKFKKPNPTNSSIGTPLTLRE